MEGTLLYVSRRTSSDADVRDIVETSRSRNARLHVTGALVASRSRFAQILEGPRWRGRADRGGSGKLHSGAEWNFCLTAARLAADQER